MEGSFFGSSEIASNHGEHVVFNLILGLEGNCVFLVFNLLLPERNLVLGDMGDNVSHFAIEDLIIKLSSLDVGSNNAFSLNSSSS